MITFQKYVKPESLEEAYALNQSPKNQIIGGMLWLRLGTQALNTAIDISGLGLNKIEETEDEYVIGAQVTLHELELHEGLNNITNYAIRDALKDIIGVQFRNMATVGGSIWSRFGFSDVLTVFLALDTYVELYKGGIISLNDFAKSKYDNDILVNIIIKKRNYRCVYNSVRIQRTDFPVLTCATSITDGELKMSIGARPGRAQLYDNSKELLTGGITEESVFAYANDLSKYVPTSTNNRGSAAYRTKLVSVLAQRNLMKLGGLL